MNDEFPSLEEMRARGYDPVSLAKGKLIAMAHAEARDLIDAIKSAFQNIPRPAITLHVARGLDDEWHLSQERFAELRALDPEENWSELGPERTDAFPEYFTFSDDEGWLFHLPAFMCNELDGFPEDTRGDEAYWACVGKEHLGLFNEEQMACVSRYVALSHKYLTSTGSIRWSSE
jgi:hypothetical protein